MRRTSKNGSQKICDNLLSDRSIVDIIAAFRKLVESSYGPNGRLKFLQTKIGSHVTVTSSSNQIINHLIGSCHPVTRMMMMAVKGHLDVFSDGGLSLAILISRLVESSLKLDIPRGVIVEVIGEAQDILTKYLTSETSPCRIKINISDMKTMLCLVKTVLMTKPACRLSQKDQDFLSFVLLKAFIQSVPNETRMSSIQPIKFMTSEGCAVNKTRLFNGVVLEANELPTYTCSTSIANIKVALYNVSMAGETDEWLEGLTPVAMAGLLREDLSSGVLDLMKSVTERLANQGVGLVACQKVIHPALKIFLKEKNIFTLDRLSILHISSVQRLSGAKILSSFTKDVSCDWLGRVGGIEHIVIGSKSYLHLSPAGKSKSSETVSSCVDKGSSMPSPSSTQSSLSSQKYTLSSQKYTSQKYTSQKYTLSSSGKPSPTVNQSCESQRQYLESCPVTTLVLCAPDESCLAELKIVCQSAISVLQGVVSSPYVSPGGGCLETHLAWYLRLNSKNCEMSSLDTLGCTRAQYIAIMDTIASCLENNARCLDHDGCDHMTDSTNHHHWILAPGEVPGALDIPSCICGLVSCDVCDNWCLLGNDDFVECVNQGHVDEKIFENNIIDLHLGKVTMLQTALETSCVILRIKHFVVDSV